MRDLQTGQELQTFYHSLGGTLNLVQPYPISTGWEDLKLIGLYIYIRELCVSDYKCGVTHFSDIFLTMVPFFPITLSLTRYSI